MPNQEEHKEVEQAVFPTKYMKKLQSLAAGFTDGVDGSDTEEIKKRILASEESIFEIEQDKENNPKIRLAKEDLKEMTAPYAESKSVETAKIKYCLHTLQSRGVKV